MKNLLVFVIVVFTSIILTAQDQDYVITLKNDTIYGKVKIINSQGSSQLITVKNGKEKTNFKVYQIKSVDTSKGEFHTLKIREQYQLARLIKSGYLSYYKFSDDENSNSSYDTPILIKRSGSQKEVSNIGFRKHIGQFLSDCEVVKEKFDSNAYSKNDLNQIIDDYNQCINDRTVAMNKTQNIKTNRNNSVKQITTIINAINSSETSDNRSEIIDMLKDVQGKLKNGENIPSYLMGALKDKMSTTPRLLQQLTEIIE
jgi:hypothetical protein